MPSLERKVYAKFGDVSVYQVANEDRAYIIELKRQLNGEDSLFINPKSKDIMWQSVMESRNTETYSIFVENQFCGSMELQHVCDDEPEIGIDLLKEQRNKGIGPKAIKALANKKNSEGIMQAFIVRIFAENIHSQHIFEKLGAIEINTNSKYEVKDNNVLRVIEQLKDTTEVRENGVVDEFLQMLDKRIVEYRLPLNNILCSSFKS